MTFALVAFGACLLVLGVVLVATRTTYIPTHAADTARHRLHIGGASRAETH